MLDWLSYKFPSIRPILKPPALKLIQNGRLEKQNLRKEMLSEKCSEVKLCTLEGDGRLRVLKVQPAA